MRPQTILLTLITALVFSSPLTHAEYQQEERYLEDTVEVGGREVKVRINSDANRVVYFWDNGANAWVDASQSQADLNKAYAEKMTFRDMQGELNSFRDETWDDRYRR